MTDYLRTTECTAVLPPENFEEAVRRLAELSFSTIRDWERWRLRPNDPAHTLGDVLEDALRRARWEGHVEEDGAFHLRRFIGEDPEDEEIAAVADLGDLFEPDGLIGWSGAPRRVYGWRVNHHGHACVSVTAHVEFDNARVVYSDAPEPADPLIDPLVSEMFVEEVFRVAGLGTAIPAVRERAARSALTWLHTYPLTTAGPSTDDVPLLTAHATRFINDYSRQDRASVAARLERELLLVPSPEL